MKVHLVSLYNFGASEPEVCGTVGGLCNRESSGRICMSLFFFFAQVDESVSSSGLSVRSRFPYRGLIEPLLAVHVRRPAPTQQHLRPTPLKSTTPRLFQLSI